MSASSAVSRQIPDEPASVPGGFAAERSMKRELLEELRASWDANEPARPEDLLRRWPTPPEGDPDVASLLYEDFLKRQGLRRM